MLLMMKMTKRRKKKHHHKNLLNILGEEKDEKKEEDPERQFLIRVKYYVHLESEYEDTFLSLFIPCTKFCLGWEPLLDKKFTLRYQMKMVRLRGKQEIKVKTNSIEDIEATVPSQSAAKDKTLGDKIGDIFMFFTSKKDDKKEDKRRHNRRRHRRYRRHRKYSDTDSSTESYSDSSSSSDAESEDERKHRKKKTSSP